jgi:uncharacterized protein (TIGR03067 family)
VDPTPNPKTIDILGDRLFNVYKMPSKGMTCKGIYSLEEDTWKICLALVGKERPTDFASKPKSGHVVIVMQPYLVRTKP